MTRWRLLLVAGLVGALVALSAVPAAQAHDACVGKSHNGTLRGVACIKGPGTDHYDLAGCDRRADTRRVRAWYWIAHTSSQFPGNWDPNGASSGCGHNYQVPNWFSMRICVEQPVGCSNWYYM